MDVSKVAQIATGARRPARRGSSDPSRIRIADGNVYRMPLPGGPSDKLGNRYELRVVVRRMLDLITGRLDWLRLEVPGEDAIEFRCASEERAEAHQIKRGISGGGHWTISALSDVIDDFGELLAAEPELRCLFTSEHAASELKELSERARDAKDLAEFTSKFLEPQWMKNAWPQLKAIWGTDDDVTYERLKRVWAGATAEEDLQQNTDAILQLLVDGNPAAARAVLVEFALESVHRELRAADVTKRLTERGFNPITTGGTQSIARTIQAPTAVGIRRAAELEHIRELSNGGKSTIFIAGISGIGKTVVASQYAAEAKAPVCWIDCEVVPSPIEALGAIGEFLLKQADDDSVTRALSGGGAQARGLARLAGQRLAAHGCVLVWDGLDLVQGERLRPTVDAIASTISSALQIVTTQEVREVGRAASSDVVQVSRLPKPSVRSLLAAAYPEARIPQLEGADEITQGHPYLVQLLIGAASTVDLETALATISTQGGPAFVSDLMSTLAPDQKRLLSKLAWLGFPFPAAYAAGLGGTLTTINDLASRSLIVRAGGNAYRVHEIVATLVAQTTSAEEQLEIRERIALFLRTLEKPTWFEVRAMLMHARAASLHEISRNAGTTLLNFAMRKGLWPLVQEAALSLTQDPESSREWYPHFVLGKCKRMTGELDAALAEYAVGESLAKEGRGRDVCQYEKASVLCELGRREEADPIYEALCKSDDIGTRVEARIGLALGMPSTSGVDSAMKLLAGALQEARDAQLQREEAEVEQSMGLILVGAERWDEAREHLERAHSLRMSAKVEHHQDIYGWYQLLSSALRVERALGNKEDAANAAHSLHRFAVLSGSLAWQSSSAHALCLSEPNADDPEVVAAVGRLRRLGADASKPPDYRITALAGLVLCEWTRRRYEESVEALLDLQALREEFKLGGPMFAHMPSMDEDEENVASIAEGAAYALLLPQGATPESLYQLVDRVVVRRPELARYAVVVEAAAPQPMTPRSGTPSVSE